MKKMKRIVALLLTACLLLVGIVFSVTSGAVDYTGNLVEYSALLDAVDAAEGAVAKVAALEKADKYLAENPINPEDEGYQAALDRAAAIKTATDALKMTELGALYTAYGNVSDTAEKRESIEAIYAFIDAVKADDTLDGFAALKAQIDASYTALKTEEILGFIENVGVSADRYATMTEFFDFAVQKGFTDEDYTAAGKLSEISALEIECVKNKLDTTVQLEDIDTKTNVIALNRVRALMADLVLDQTAAGYTEFKTAFDTAVAAHEAQKAINYEELLLDSWYVHYGEKNQFDYSFQDTLKPSFITKNLANSYIRVESGEDPLSADNKYVTVFHSRQDALDGAGNVGKGNHIYTSDSLVAGKKGFVVEVDITTFGEWVANGTYSNVKCAGVTVDGESFTLSNGKYLALWCIDGKGNLGASRESVTAGKVFMENVIVPGQWLHLTCVFNPDKPADERLALYVDYELVATFDPNPEVKTFEISEIRVGQQNVEGEFSLDNFSFNWGGSVRDEAWFNALSLYGMPNIGLIE